MEEFNKTEAEWKQELPPERYHVLREKGTEPAFSGELLDYRGNGMFTCAACGAQLFDPKTKFESGTGWPSFSQALPGAVKEIEDEAFGMKRTEVVCARCGSHLGHVFPDGPKPTGLRYCMNSLALKVKE